MTQLAVLGQDGLDASALAAANVHPESGLATDYLNHFNEVVMLIGMLADMPEMAEDVLDWAPCGYEDHFYKTGYAGAETVVAAYEAVPRTLRAHFETIIAALDGALVEAQALVQRREFEAAAGFANAEIEPLLAAARAAVMGQIEGESVDDRSAAQAGVDALFG